MARRLVVTGNCQASSLAVALGGVLPREAVIAFDHRMHMHPQVLDQALDAIAAADIWITTRAERDHLQPLLAGPPPPVLLWPAMEFSGFHPDQVMAFLPGGQPFSGCCSGYHSAIGLWAWKQGLNAAQASELFRAEVFEALGYFGHFAPALDHLGRAFRECDLDFQPVWAALRRQGPFMHTVNHPTLAATLAIARLLGARLGATPEDLAEPLERFLDDPLAYVVWPIYPPIARHLGIPGGWRLRFREHQWAGLRDWLGDLFASYGDQAPGSVTCDRLADESMDRLLSSALRGLP